MTDTLDFIDWLDDQAEPEPRAESWACDTIEKAEAAARRLRAAVDKIAEIDRTADRIIDDANAWRAEMSAPYALKREGLERDIETFLRTQISEGGPKSAPLPWGISVSARKTGGTLEFADGFADTAPDEVVREKRVIDAKAAKKYYTVTDTGEVVDPNGEIVEGVSVKPVVDKVTVQS